MTNTIKNNIGKIFNVSIEYVNYGFVSNYKNSLLLKIEKSNKNKKDSLVFLTNEGKLKSVNLEDEDNIKVSITSLW